MTTDDALYPELITLVIRKKVMYRMQLYSQLTLRFSQVKQPIQEQSEQLLPNSTQQKAQRRLERIKDNYYLERRLFL